ncbi:DEKNAAC103912 [Brettanomyces naardenensis]|uniref:DEKNAAC103912 n=1 Tax=Brettanomyces naardenensis TaxID=13370 RepID=A0A448YPH0_BRENA|nr:DEKNAAC103912 [Brettanomyces naardenensis]
MSIHLREGFSDETLERVLEDLAVRFVVNCPTEDLSGIERVFFQIEEAHWFYQDFARALNPLLPPLKMKQFTTKLLERCPLIWKWGDPREALARFGKYKSIIPVRGCALFSPDLDKVLLVQGTESSSWSFPRGKISKDETDTECAIRELKEETGFDGSSYIDEDEYVERTIKGKNYKIFLVRGVPLDTPFSPIARNEIRQIKWFDVKSLLKQTRTTNNFYLVGAMIKPILAFTHRMKSLETEEELKRKATAQLKKILGVGEQHVETDPGRALLTMLQKASSASKVENPETQTLQKQPNVLPPIPPIPGYSGLPGYPGMPPFPLPFFNPYFLPPQFPLPPQAAGVARLPMQPMLPMETMAPVGPAPSSLGRPTFDNSNGKELLKLLKRKKSTDNSQHNGKELLKLLKSPKEEGNGKELLKVLKSPKEEGNGKELLKLLKRGPKEVPKEALTQASPDTDNEILKLLKTPRNNPVRRDQSQIGNPSFLPDVFQQNKSLNEGKKIRILKRQDTTGSQTQSGDSQSTQISPLASAPSSKPSGASQLLGILKTKPSTTSSAATVHKHNITPASLPKVINDRPETQNNEDPSSYLLGLLGKPKTSSSNATSNSAGSQLLNLLKRPSSKPTTTGSDELLGILKGPKEEKGSKVLLNLLKRPDSNAEVELPSVAQQAEQQAKQVPPKQVPPKQQPLKQQPTDQQPAVSSAASLLSVLKGKDSRTNGQGQKVEEEQEPEGQAPEPGHTEENPPDQDTQPHKEQVSFSDYSDFDDLDDGSDGYEGQIKTFVDGDDMYSF